ncbi:MAG TPA: hypothetical protein VNK95_02020 [Caldilineaceae bacterium]|nr:hypothetical protein [Caldilineaceae bacterium]
MLEISKISWGRMVGAATGSALAGPVGGLVGNLAGGLLQNFLPGAAAIGAVLGAIVSKTLEKSSDTLASQWNLSERQQINHDLQTAFRDALIEAIYDIGGENCFPDRWQRGRDVPTLVVYPLSTLQRQDAALADQACAFLQQMAAAVTEQRILPLEPPTGQPAASVTLYLEAETPEALNRTFFEQVIAPYLQDDEGQSLLGELRGLGLDLEAHLRQHLLDRTLVHLGELLKERTHAWRAFNRLMLENLRAQLREASGSSIAGGANAQLAQVETELAELQRLLQTSNLAGSLADLMSAFGQMEKRMDEGFDTLFRRLERDHHEVVERLQGLLGAAGRIEAKVDRMLLILENGQWEVIGAPTAPIDEPPEPGEPPFLGLQHFTEADAHRFFGREMLTARLVGRLRQARFLAVVGTSGSGKSSLVRAGLVPALRRGAPLADGALPPEGSSDWLIHVITPTAHPLETLAATLTRDAHGLQETTALLKDLAGEPRSLLLHARKLLSRRDQAARSHARLLLVVDQFEELFTLCRSEQERSAFIANLLAAVTSNNASDGALDGAPAEGPVTVVIVLRADFYGHCAAYEGLRNVLVRSQEFIGPMSEDELRRAIEEPAKQGGWQFERGVVELLLRDVGNEPGALPLLSHALLETWKRRRGRTMTLESYAESGMVRGAIAQTAEYVFNRQLTPEQRPLVKNIFLRLTELGESTRDSRRRVALDELRSAGRTPEDVETILQRLVEARLVTVGEGTVELAHEALIREWPALRQWLVENREWLRIHRHLTEAAQEWEALARDPGELYRGGRLAQVLEWVEPHWEELNQLEREFLTASRQLAEQEETERRSRQQRELEQARALAEVERRRAEEQSRAAEQLRRRAVLLGALLAVALILAAISVIFAREANHNAILASQNAATAQAASTAAIEQQTIAAAERDRAEQQAQVALSRQLAAQALNLTNDLDLGLLLSLEANRAAPGSFESRSSLLSLLQTSPQLTTFLHGHNAIVFDVAVSPDGSLAASASQDQTILLWDLETYQPIERLTGHTNWVNTVTFSPDGSLLASGSNGVQLWDLTTLAPAGELFAAGDDLIWALAFHPTSNLLAVGNDAGVITLWDLADPAHPAQVGEPLARHTDQVRSLDFSPDGTILASGSWDGAIILWDVTDPAQPEPLGPPLQEHTDWVRSIAFSPNGRLLASGSADNTVILWDVADPSNPEPIAPPLTGYENLVYTVAFSLPDGELLATAGGDKSIVLWDVSDPTQPERVGSPFIGQAGVIQSLAFSPDGRLLSASDDTTVAVWNLERRQRLTQGLSGHTGGVNNVAFRPDGALIASASDDGTVRLWDASDPHQPQPLGTLFPGTPEVWMRAVAFSLDGRLLATGDISGTLRLWDLTEPDNPQPLGQPVAAHTDWLRTLVYHPDGTILASAGDDTLVRLWDVRDPAAVTPLGEPLAGHTDWALSLAFNADGTILASGGGDNRIVLWDVATQEQKAVLAGHSWRVWGLGFAPTSNLLASGGQDSFMILWDVDQILASTDPNSQVWTLDTEPRVAQAFTNHANTVAAVAFSPDGTLLASAGVEQMVFLWDMATRRPIGPPLAAHTAAVVSAVFSPDGQWLATGGYDNEIYLWDVSYASWQARACRIANRNLTPAEWAQYVGAAPYQAACPELPAPPGP